MYTLQTRCRACGYGPKLTAKGIKAQNSGDRLVKVFDLGLQPMANDFQDESGERSGFAPLEVLLCPSCTLAQLSVVVRPDILYRDYHYITSASDTMQRHFAALWNKIQTLGKSDNVVEIGSNTGDFLAFASAHGARRVIGVDPAENLAVIAEGKGVPTIPFPFKYSTAVESDKRVGSADVVIARHVFCHVDDWRGFLESLSIMGHENTRYYIEVPYAGDMIKSNSWDQIYHEHLSYLTLRGMKAAVSSTGLCILGVDRYPIHGGALVIALAHRSPEAQRMEDRIADFEKEDIGLQEWMDFSSRAKQEQRKLKEMIEGLVEQGKTVVGFGASAKSTVWINACKLNRTHLRFICDNTPQKQHRCSPGTEIPVTDEGSLLRELPDFAVVFCWNFIDEVMEKQKLYLKKGGRFIVPIPEIRIVPDENRA